MEGTDGMVKLNSINYSTWKYEEHHMFSLQQTKAYEKRVRDLKILVDQSIYYQIITLITTLSHFNYTLTLQEPESIDSLDVDIYAEIKTRIPDTISWDYNFEPAGSTPLTFTVKEAIDDLEWPGASIQITLQPTPPSVTFRGDGHGDLQIDFTYYSNVDLLIAFHCDCQVSHRYKYKFLKATTSNIPSSVIRDNRGSKLTINRVSRSSTSHTHIESASYQPPSRITYIEFFVKP
ncbi:hypothetical protein UlMin_035167 [Ulmus minor]